MNGFLLEYAYADACTDICNCGVTHTVVSITCLAVIVI